MKLVSDREPRMRAPDVQLLRKGDADSEVGTATEAALSIIPRDISPKDYAVSGELSPRWSDLHISDHTGKLALLDRMLNEFYKTTQEKVVVVSNWTATLDVIQGLCKARRYAFLRLDGSTNAKDRQGLVDAYNRESKENSFVFLLSAKAGGVGLNLIG
jgi:DNA repair and recombination protein RAD54B